MWEPFWICTVSARWCLLWSYMISSLASCLSIVQWWCVHLPISLIHGLFPVALAYLAYLVCGAFLDTSDLHSSLVYDPARLMFLLDVDWLITRIDFNTGLFLLLFYIIFFFCVLVIVAFQKIPCFLPTFSMCVWFLGSLTKASHNFHKALHLEPCRFDETNTQHKSK